MILTRRVLSAYALLVVFIGAGGYVAQNYLPTQHLYGLLGIEPTWPMVALVAIAAVCGIVARHQEVGDEWYPFWAAVFGGLALGLGVIYGPAYPHILEFAAHIGVALLAGVLGWIGQRFLDEVVDYRFQLSY